ncbi:hypothetical protein BGZ57DRAFT_996250 [Hyaloscypha finlandica]|nr:hypothetical protein BGZ57DRAFT_996250 [Hyaloscypha finlandica]
MARGVCEDWGLAQRIYLEFCPGGDLGVWLNRYYDLSVFLLFYWQGLTCFGKPRNIAESDLWCIFQCLERAAFVVHHGSEDPKSERYKTDGKVVLKATEELTSSVLVGDQALDNEHGNQPPYKINDFGLSKMVTSGPQDAKYLKQYLYYGTCSWYAPVSLTYSDIKPEDVAKVLISGASHQHIPRRLLFAAMETLLKPIQPHGPRPPLRHRDKHLANRLDNASPDAQASQQGTRLATFHNLPIQSNIPSRHQRPRRRLHPRRRARRASRGPLPLQQRTALAHRRMPATHARLPRELTAEGLRQQRAARPPALPRPAQAQAPQAGPAGSANAAIGRALRVIVQTKLKYGGLIRGGHKIIAVVQVKDAPVGRNVGSRRRA